MTRFMADSITGSELVDKTVSVPGHGTQTLSLTAGYANGSFHGSSQDPQPTDVQIDVNGTAPGADVLDIEQHDATPQQAATWVHSHNAHGGATFPAVLYCNRSTRSQVKSVLDTNGLVVNRDYKWWISTLDGTETLSDMDGVVAVQAWGASDFPRNIDVSIVYDDSWKPTSAPPSVPVPEDEIMYTFVLPAAPQGGRFPVTLPVSRACEITLSAEGEATLTAYGWISPAGGNGFQEVGVHLHDQGAYAFRPDKGTGKVDVQYTSAVPIYGVVDVIG